MTRGRKKALDSLDDGGGLRCCLGHACYVLGIEKTVSPHGIILYGDEMGRYLAPDELIEMVGLWDDSGKSFSGEKLLDDNGVDILSLTSLNDDTDYSPKQIGQYLMSVIMGGVHTPFKKIKV